MTNQDKREAFWFRVFFALLAIVLASALWLRRSPTAVEQAQRPQPPVANQTGMTSAVTPGRDSGPDRFTRAMHELRASSEPERSRQTLAELQSILSGMSLETASTLIRSILDSNVDSPTQLDFAVGPDGFLKQPSSLRVFLLDHLAKVDPAAAAAYAEKILGSFNSSDEWAVSLRNYASHRTDANGRAFLHQKVREMLHHEPWQKNPSVGYLEAFDVAVHTGGAELLPDLTELVRKKDNQAVAHASYLALDRLTIQAPTSTLETLQKDPKLMQGREVTRANYFARASVEDPKQRAILESYLLDSARPPDELQTFAGLFPNANFMISHNLLTRTSTPTGDTLARQDRAALQAVNDWLADPRFQTIRPHLEKIKTRLEGFVGKVAAGNNP